jgi:hypothetical protein
MIMSKYSAMNYLVDIGTIIENLFFKGEKNKS